VSQTTDLKHPPPPQNPKRRESRQICVTKHSDETLPNTGNVGLRQPLWTSSPMR
jgi:hypothetical protein